jgi:phosphatidylinositol 4-kinase
MKISIIRSSFLYSKFVEEKRVFNEIEFYLPQIAHLIIHLDVDWIAQSLGRLAVVLSQTSIHTALQLCFILIAAMEDNQPEKPDGTINPDGNIIKYFHCARLLQNVQKAVVFGSPTLTAQEEKLLLSQVSMIQMSELKDFEKDERADQIIHLKEYLVTNPSTITTANKIDNCIFEGYLLYKRLEKKSVLKSKKWTTRFFKIDQKILLCYKEESSKMPTRAISLENCDLFLVKREKYEFQFELLCKSSGMKYQLRATDQTSFDNWMEALRRFIYIYICVYMYIYIYVNMYVYMCIYI